MKGRQKLTLIVLVALLAATGIGLYLTSGSNIFSPSGAANSESRLHALSINVRSLNAAVRLALLAETPEEQHAARNALDAADREMDLQYAYLLQLASIEPIPQTPKILAIQNRITQINKAIETRQTEAAQLQRAVARVRGARRRALEDQLTVSEAELSLLHEALKDANSELDRAGGSLNGRLDKLKAEHMAASAEHDNFKFPPLGTSPVSGSMLAKWELWRMVRYEEGQIDRARQEVLADAAAFARQHNALTKLLATEEAQRKEMERHELTPAQIAALLATPTGGEESKAPGAKEASQAQPAPPLSPTTVNPAIALIQRISASRLMLRILESRIQSMNTLAAAYTKWNSIEASAGRGDLHSLLGEVLWIVLLMILAFFLNRVAEHFFNRMALERKQRTTLQAVVRITVRVALVIVILMMIFGKPRELSTVLGLMGAGLAVALQDFILSFFGWFVLMGRHGIHVGDWVEINPNSFTGVRGEVIEITLFRTVLLETGNWNEPGHLTGRQVAFMNMYAVGGYYFNFSTSGQWLWDELQVTVPAGRDPAPLVEKIQALVAKETESHRDPAERDWERFSSRYGTRAFSTQPTVNVKPTDQGVIAVVRYVTRADERTAMSYRLNREIVRLLHPGEELLQVQAGTDDPASGER